MKCEEVEILLHALIDDELDAGHARDVETHVAACNRCAAQLRDYRAMHGALASAKLGYAPPAGLRARIDARLPAPAVKPNRRILLKGFALGTGISALAASAVVVAVMRNDQDSRMMAEIVSAHLRSLQADHLIDVQSTDQHTVKPWFNGKLDAAPPVTDLTAQGFTLIGGRLDYLDGKAVAALVYRRRIHVINLFVAQSPGTQRHAAIEASQGFNVRHWSEHGFSLWAISDLNAEELEDFGRRFAAAQSSGT